jgi:acyl carrier protein
MVRSIGTPWQPPVRDQSDVDDHVAPRTPFEQEIANIWSELLDVRKVGIHDNFFELGGQSLVAVALTARIRDEFGVELTIRDLYNNFTVAEVAWLVLTRMTDVDGGMG